MTQPDRPQRRAPKRRSDATRPPSTRTRRGGERRPYPTAPTRTRPSPGKPATATGSRSRGSASPPIPATVWACGPIPITLGATWPTPIVSQAVTAFSQPGDRVVLLPWPTLAAEPPTPTPVRSERVIDGTAGAEHDDELATALAVINEANRTGHMVRVNAASAAAGPPSRPFWADLVSDPDHAPTATTEPPPAGLDGGILDGADAAPGEVDLIITSLRPEVAGDHTSDLVALLAARLLRVGGILAVLTHCDWSRGELVDPTGPVVAAGQNADLLYLQHIVALHAQVRDGQFTVEFNQPAFDTYARTRHRAVVRRLPAPHRRIHSDVLVFAQPRDHQPPSLTPTDAAIETGVIR